MCLAVSCHQAALVVPAVPEALADQVVPAALEALVVPEHLV